MTESKDRIDYKDKNKQKEVELEKENEKQRIQQHQEQQSKSEKQHDRSPGHKNYYDTQRIYKKTSQNCVLTLYLPSREIILSGNSSSVLRGIVLLDTKAIQGHQVYAQLTLTFRYGREDEEVMGLRFCNEAIMSLYQIWPRNEKMSRESLSPLQEALLKRLGDDAHPFTLTLKAQAPSSVQLVPAKRYYGAPIGTSYDVRCFIADKTDEKFHRRALVKMGVRVLYHTTVFNHGVNGPENLSTLINNPISSPPVTLACTNTHTTTKPPIYAQTTDVYSTATAEIQAKQQEIGCPNNMVTAKDAGTSSNLPEIHPANKPRKSERGDSFPKLRLSPKTFRFSGRFGRSKSEVDKYSNDSFYHCNKSFQEYDTVAPCGGPHGTVDKPFLLQDGRVSLRASLDKAWYTHGEDVCVTIYIKNDSKKTVKKIRVCAIQHVDVCMFNNGKFKNVVADSDNLTLSPINQHVSPGATLHTKVVLKPQRGPTKNWIALEDTLQRSTEPDEINAAIAASAARIPHFLMQANNSPNNCLSPAVFVPATLTGLHVNSTTDEHNIFAIYVSYYIKVKLTLSTMGGELSLKLPFMLVHLDKEQYHLHEAQKLNLDDIPATKKDDNKYKGPLDKIALAHEFVTTNNLDLVDSMDEANVKGKIASMDNKPNFSENNSQQTSISTSNGRRRLLQRSETLAKDAETEEDDVLEKGEDDEEKCESASEQIVHVIAQIHTSNYSNLPSSNTSESTDQVLDHNKVTQKIYHNKSVDDIQQVTEKLDAEELCATNMGSQTLANTTNGV